MINIKESIFRKVRKLAHDATNPIIEYSKKDFADDLYDAAQHHINLIKKYGENHPRAEAAADHVNELENRYFDKHGGFDAYANRYLDLYRKENLEENMTNINEGYVVYAVKKGTKKVSHYDHVGDIIDNKGNVSYSSPMDAHPIAAKYVKMYPDHDVHIVSDSGVVQTFRGKGKRKWLGENTLKESHFIPPFSNVLDKDKHVKDLLSKHGTIEEIPQYPDDDIDYQKAYYLKHPTNPNHTMIIRHSHVDKGGLGFRYSGVSPYHLDFEHYKHRENDDPMNGSRIVANKKFTKDDAFDDNFHHLKRYLENDWKKVGTMNESYNLVENTKKVLPDNLMAGYVKFISKQNSYNNLGVVNENYTPPRFQDGMPFGNRASYNFRKMSDADHAREAQKAHRSGDHELRDIHHTEYNKRTGKTLNFSNNKLEEGIKDFFKTHEPDGTETYDTDPHETEASFGYTLNRFREAGGNKWDLHIKGSHGRRIAGEKVTPFGKHIMGAKPIPYKTTGTLLGSFVHKENPEHRIDFALGRDGKGGTKILNAHHNMSGSSISNASIGDMEQFMGKLTRTAKGYQGLTEGLFGPHKSEKVHEKGLAALLKNGFKLDPTAEKYNARAGKYLHFGQTEHHYLVHPNGKHKVAYSASSSPDYHSVYIYDGDVEDDNHLFTGNFKTPERMIQGLKDLKEALNNARYF